MANDVNLSSSVRTNLLSLQSTSKLLSKTQEKLATGLKVNSALDNPASYFTAKRLNDRAADLASRKDGIGQGIQTLKSADKAMKALDKLVANAKSLANRALDEDASRTYATITGTTVDPADTVTTAGSITITLTNSNGTSSTLKFTQATGMTIADLVKKVDALEGVSAKINSDNKVVIETEDESVTNMSITGDLSATNLEIANNGSITAVTTTDADALETRKKLAKEFDDLRTQMKQLVDDAGYKGVNLLKGSDLTVKFNENGKSKLDISGVNFDVTDSAGDVYVATAVNNWAGDADIDAAMTEIDKATTALRQQASTFGSNLSTLEVRDEFTKDLINALEEGAGKLVQADLNEEGANLLALQTRQTLATTSLSLAAQAEQGVLRLF